MPGGRQVMARFARIATLIIRINMQSQSLFSVEIKPFPVESRFNLFIALAQKNPLAPETVVSDALAHIFIHDLYVFKATLASWARKKELAASALLYISEFFANIDLTQPISFQQHAYYCFVLSAFASGVIPLNLATAYDRQLQPMVTGTIYPKGKWSIKEEIENQYYAKLLYHVSENGIVEVPMFNRTAAFSVTVSGKVYYYSVGIIAAACGETLEFDGVTKRVAKDATGAECTSLCVQNHDYIHRGFAKYAVMHDSERYWQCITKLAIMHAGIEADAELKRSRVKYGQVQAAYFMWTHELTTSAFVHGFARRLPSERSFFGGQRASAPQMLLRFASKIYIPELFAKEIANEASILQSLGVPCLQNPNMSSHEQIKEVMEHLSHGYQYLHEHFSELYGHQGWFEAFTARVSQKIFGPSI